MADVRLMEKRLNAKHMKGGSQSAKVTPEDLRKRLAVYLPHRLEVDTDSPALPPSSRKFGLSGHQESGICRLPRVDRSGGDHYEITAIIVIPLGGGAHGLDLGAAAKT